MRERILDVIILGLIWIVCCLLVLGEDAVVIRYWLGLGCLNLLMASLDYFRRGCRL